MTILLNMINCHLCNKPLIKKSDIFTCLLCKQNSLYLCWVNNDRYYLSDSSKKYMMICGLDGINYKTVIRRLKSYQLIIELDYKIIIDPANSKNIDKIIYKYLNLSVYT